MLTLFLIGWLLPAVFVAIDFYRDSKKKINIGDDLYLYEVLLAVGVIVLPVINLVFALCLAFDMVETYYKERDWKSIVIFKGKK